MVILDCEIATVAPSVNHYWIATGKRRFLSKRAKDFQKIVSMFVKPHKSTARLKIEITFHFPDKRVRDLDNYLKGTLDSLVKAGLCVDDEQFDKLIIDRGNIVKGGLIKIRVTER